MSVPEPEMVVRVVMVRVKRNKAAIIIEFVGKMYETSGPAHPRR